MKAIDKKKSNTMSGVFRHMNREFLFSCIVWLAVCPLWGQTNFGIDAHLEDDRLLLELDEEVLDTPMHLVRLGVGYHHIQWSRQGDHILLSLSLIESQTGTLIPPIVRKPKIHKQLLGRFDIIADKGPDHSVVIDATDLFLKTHIQYEYYAKQNVVGELSFIDQVDRYPDQLIIRTQRTIEGSDGRKTIDADFSLYLLPEPMEPRLYDQRMAFNSEVVDIRLDHENQTWTGSIERWRLEKRNRFNGLATPIQPIVFYLDSQIPDPWRPHVKKGVLEWLTALEAAGFKDAIEVREVSHNMVPGTEQLKRTAMVHWDVDEKMWKNKSDGTSQCSTVRDQRTGEILRADVYLGGLERLAMEYFVRCAPLDSRAQKFPFPEDLMGELIQSVIAHEVGHALGLRDGNFGEYAYPFEKMRDTQWLKQMSHVPSIMSYSRHHHIVQPSDSIPTSLLMQRVGPMDLYQIKWGYLPLDSGQGEQYLEQLVRLQDSVPWYRYNFKKSPALGPDSSGEVGDNDDPVRSMVLALKNLERVMTMIASIGKGQKDDDLLMNVHERAIGLWYREMGHVLSMVGGYTVQLKSGDQNGWVYTPVPMEEQKRALTFLLENAFDLPQWLSKPAYLGRIHHSTESDQLLIFQIILLKELVSDRRMQRMEFMERVHGLEGLPEHVLAEVMEAMFKELVEKKVVVGKRRQTLQKALLGQFAYAVEEEGRVFSESDVSGRSPYIYTPFSKNIIAIELQKIKEKLEKGIRKSGESATKGHLTLCRRYWNEIGEYLGE
ncbi:zinc-dependent metalloprotease [Flagellimonas iocasae]|uniref:Zinc-dependent metalloprotease n=1 Tax=Flagellimonas iocasae TaxID=2055905 RepID=A0ABW4Y2F5_9FLAO